MPLKKSSGLVKRFTDLKNSVPFKWDDGATTIFLIAVGVAAAVMVSAALRSNKPAEGATANAPSKTVSAQVRASRAPDAATANTPPSKSAPKDAKASAPESPVTITGCLELDKETFRLKDTAGLDAPKSRSWKSGFLKKKTASIAIVDATNKVKLPNHVGERVEVTGMLVDREMQVRSLQRIATSCNQEA
jgi:hypothetical protein